MNPTYKDITLDELAEMFTSRVIKMKSRVDKRLAQEIYNDVAKRLFDENGELRKEQD